MSRTASTPYATSDGSSTDAGASASGRFARCTCASTSAGIRNRPAPSTRTASFGTRADRAAVTAAIRPSRTMTVVAARAGPSVPSISVTSVIARTDQAARADGCETNPTNPTNPTNLLTHSNLAQPRTN